MSNLIDLNLWLLLAILKRHLLLLYKTDFKSMFPQEFFTILACRCSEIIEVALFLIIQASLMTGRTGLLL